MVLVSAEVRTIPAGEVQLPVEIIILGKLRCPFIVSAFYYFTRQVASDVSLSLLKNSTYSFHPIPFKLFYCVILNAMPSDMEKLTRNDKVWLDRVDAAMYSWQLLRAIEHLEQKAVIHLDIKPSNILVNHEVCHKGSNGPYFMSQTGPKPKLNFQIHDFSRILSMKCIRISF